MAVLLNRENRWECPNCDLQDITYELNPHSRMHNCRGLAGLSVPMVPAGTKCKMEAHLREDYIGSEIVQTDSDGRPVMSVTTTREEGEDCTVYAPVAVVRGQVNE